VGRSAVAVNITRGENGSKSSLQSYRMGHGMGGGLNGLRFRTRNECERLGAGHVPINERPGKGDGSWNPVEQTNLKD